MTVLQCQVSFKIEVYLARDHKDARSQVYKSNTKTEVLDDSLGGNNWRIATMIHCFGVTLHNFTVGINLHPCLLVACARKELALIFTS